MGCSNTKAVTLEPAHTIRSPVPADEEEEDVDAFEGKRETLEEFESRINSRLEAKMSMSRDEAFRLSDHSPPMHFSCVMYPGFTRFKRKVSQDAFVISEVFPYHVQKGNVKKKKGKRKSAVMNGTGHANHNHAAQQQSVVITVPSAVAGATVDASSGEVEDEAKHKRDVQNPVAPGIQDSSEYEQQQDYDEANANRQDEDGKCCHHAPNPRVGGTAPANGTSHEEDAAAEDLSDESKWYLFAVFDGHGDFGHRVSDFLARTFPETLNMCMRKTSKVTSAFNEAFLTSHRALTRTTINLLSSGSTATCVLLNDSKLYIAHVGDSRAVLATRLGNKLTAIDLCHDHNCENKEEVARITDFGGEVRQVFINNKYMGPKRVFIRDADVPGLAVTRSIGDELGHEAGVSSEPELNTRKLTSHDEFIIVASDGVWDQFDSQQAVDFIAKEGASSDAADKLIAECARLWLTKQGGLCDDISCIIVFLRDFVPSS